ncbi:hypothetical protein [Maribacter halichondriae]|uniref:hypothetical protein n=1 Tax=Maribacter halichondriae TaxID=2980554 RepID=UPI002359AE04|nr:hypothetical protein [Maribacter sp. Hal144]
MKIYSRLSKDVYLNITKKSQEQQVPFTGHIPESNSIWESIKANQQSLEYLYGLLEGCSSQQEELLELNKTDPYGQKKAALYGLKKC